MKKVAFTQTGGSTLVDGTLGQGSVIFTGGTLTGKGTVGAQDRNMAIDNGVRACHKIT